jgi:hypothetical protein
MNAKQYEMVKVRGITTKWARKNHIESGVTTLFASNSVIDDDSRELIIPTNDTIKVIQTESDQPDPLPAACQVSWCNNKMRSP